MQCKLIQTSETLLHSVVTPSEDGVQNFRFFRRKTKTWIPASAGMTGFVTSFRTSVLVTFLIAVALPSVTLALEMEKEVSSFDPLVGSTQSVSSLTLKECFQLALKQNEALQIKAEEIAQLEARTRQVKGNVLPHLTFNMTNLIQDTKGVNNESGGVGGTLTRRERLESKFVARQPLFQGFKDQAAIIGSKAEGRKEKWLLKRLSVILFKDVADAFFTVVRFETEFSGLKEILNLTVDRVSELKARRKVGKSRESEVLSAESQLSTLRSREEKLVGQLDVAREDLSFVIGQEMGQTKLIDNIALPEQMPLLDDLFRKAEMRADILAFQEDIEAKRQGIRVAKSGRWPGLNLTGNYYTRRVGFQKEIDWDLLFNLDVPLYRGGGVSAQIDEAMSRLKQSEKEFQRLKRDVQAEVKRSHAALSSSIKEVKMLREAYEKAKKSYDIQVKEYRLGLVNNLEVLQALNGMQQVKDDYDRAFIQSKLNFLDLQVAIEETP